MPIEVTRLIVKSTLLEPEPSQAEATAVTAEDLQQLKEDILQECQRLFAESHFEQRLR